MEFGTSNSVEKSLNLNENNPVDLAQLKSKSNHWSLGDDIKLVEALESIGDNLISKSELIYSKLDSLDHESQFKLIKTTNIINEFQMLANSQFVENRAYDEEAKDISFNHSKDLNQQEISNKNSNSNENLLKTIQDALLNSFKFIDDNFKLSEKVSSSQNESDDDEDYVTENLSSAILNNSFNRNPLPFIIGSDEFLNDTVFGHTDDVFEPGKLDSKLDTDKGEYNSDESDVKDNLENEILPSTAETGSFLFKNLEDFHENVYDVYRPSSSSDIGSINKKLNHQNYNCKEDSDNDDLFKSTKPKVNILAKDESTNSILTQVKAQIQSQVQAELAKKFFSESSENVYQICYKNDHDKGDTDVHIINDNDNDNDNNNDNHSDSDSEENKNEKDFFSTTENLDKKHDEKLLPVQNKKLTCSPTSTLRSKTEIQEKLSKLFFAPEAKSIIKKNIQSSLISSKNSDFDTDSDSDDLFKSPLKTISKTSVFDANNCDEKIKSKPSAIKPKIESLPKPPQVLFASDNDNNNVSNNTYNDSSKKTDRNSNKNYEDNENLKEDDESSDDDDDLFVIKKSPKNELSKKISSKTYTSDLLSNSFESKIKNVSSFAKSSSFSPSNSNLSALNKNSVRNIISKDLFSSSSDQEEDKVVQTDKTKDRLNFNQVFSSESDSDDLFKDLSKKTLKKPLKNSTSNNCMVPDNQEIINTPKVEDKTDCKFSQKINSLFLSEDDDDDLFSISKKPTSKPVSESFKSNQSSTSNSNNSFDTDSNELKVEMLNTNHTESDVKFLANSTSIAPQAENKKNFYLNLPSSDSDEDLFCALRKNSKSKLESVSYKTISSNQSSMNDSTNDSTIEQDLFSQIEKKSVKLPVEKVCIFDKTLDSNQSSPKVAKNKSKDKKNESLDQDENKDNLFDDLNLSLLKSYTILNNDHLKSKVKLGAARNKRNPTRR